MALTSVFGMSSSVIGPVVSGFIRDLTGSFGTALYLGAGLAFAGALLTRLIPESAKQPRPSAELQTAGFAKMPSPGDHTV